MVDDELGKCSDRGVILNQGLGHAFISAVPQWEPISTVKYC